MNKYIIEVLGNLDSLQSDGREEIIHVEPANSKFVYTLVDEGKVALSVIQCPILEEIPKNSVIKITKI